VIISAITPDQFMPDKTITRRSALKVITVGAGSASALTLLDKNVVAQQGHAGMEMPAAAVVAPQVSAPRFFGEAELATIAIISELIIPADEHSPGARAAGVSDFIDLMVSESSAEVKTLWRNGLAALDRLSSQKLSVAFRGASAEQQIAILTAISRNEYRPRTTEERFFVAIKSMTVDGYYTSQTGIHQELQYKGNAYLKEFNGCTHPEHTS